MGSNVGLSPTRYALSKQVAYNRASSSRNTFREQPFTCGNRLLIYLDLQIPRRLSNHALRNLRRVPSGCVVAAFGPLNLLAAEDQFAEVRKGIGTESDLQDRSIAGCGWKLSQYGQPSFQLMRSELNLSLHRAESRE